MKGYWTILPIALVFMTLISACLGSPLSSAELTPPPFQTSKPVEKPQSAEIVPSFSKTQSVIQCTQPGKVSQADFFSIKLNAQLKFDIYFPPCYEDGSRKDYPALYLLHGQTYDQTQWQKLGVQTDADHLIQDGKSLPFLIIMPYEQYQYRPVQGNAFPRAILEELIPWVEANLHARQQRSWRAIGGISRGASWAMRLALQNPSVFGAVGGHSLPTFNGDLDQLPDWLKDVPRDQMPRIYIDIGSSDPEVASAIQFDLQLNRLGILNEWHLNLGRHNEEYWAQHVNEYLEWYSRNWGVPSGS